MKWQKQWEEEEKGRNPEEGWSNELCLESRMEKVVFTRLRTGHTRLNNTLYKIGKHSTGGCDYCSEEHVLVHCRKY